MSETPPNAVREKLLNAAEHVVARKGVRSMTLEAVALQAGISKGGLLYHFPSKQALVTAIVERFVNRCEREQNEAVEADPKPGAFSRAYLLTRSKFPAPEEELVHIAILAAAGTDPFYLQPFRSKLAEWQARLENDGIDPATATIVRLAIDGYCLCRLLSLPVPEGDLRARVIAELASMASVEAAGSSDKPEPNLEAPKQDQ